MNWTIPEFVILAQLILAAVLGGVVGWERRYHNRLESEVRTFASVALGACAFGSDGLGRVT